MGYRLETEKLNQVLAQWSKDYLMYAPRCFEGDGTFSDTDTIRYGQIERAEEIIFDKKSDYSFKEILLPLSQTLFYFTEDEVKEASPERRKKAIVFLRSCDLHSLKRLDYMYLKNGSEDYYYKRLRENVKFILMGCAEEFSNCFCTAMRTNQPEEYDLCINQRDESYEIDCRCEEWIPLFEQQNPDRKEVTPDYIRHSEADVEIPENIPADIQKAALWNDYDGRCIACGRCTYVCPTCTCFTMQDIFYTDNGNAGERRRVWASCMVDGYTDVAGGGSYRKKNGEHMRFKVMHKLYDFKEKAKFPMCVGCGRCESICPEYISYIDCIDRIKKAGKEEG